MKKIITTKAIFIALIQKARLSVFNNMIKLVNSNSKCKDKLVYIYSKIGKLIGVSEHFKWAVNWTVTKYEDEQAYNQNKPFDIAIVTENIVLDSGANEMLKLIGGITNATAFNNANAKIGVGDSSTAENATQTGLLGTNKAYATMDIGFPEVTGRAITFKATFDTTQANFPINEICVINGTGASAISLNRKVQYLGTKSGGIWTVQVTISLTSV